MGWAGTADPGKLRSVPSTRYGNIRGFKSDDFLSFLSISHG